MHLSYHAIHKTYFQNTLTSLGYALHHDDVLNSFDLAADLTTALTASYDRKISLVDVERLDAVNAFARAHRGLVTDVAFANWCGDRGVRAIFASAGQEVLTLTQEIVS